MLFRSDERAPGRMASFELWDDFVRQSVVWVGRGIGAGKFADPMDAVITAQLMDPEQESLGDMLRAWRHVFGEMTVSSAEIIRRLKENAGFAVIPTGPEQDLQDALNGFSSRATDSAKSLGRILKYRVGRIIRGLKLEKVKDNRTNTNNWRVVEVG